MLENKEGERQEGDGLFFRSVESQSLNVRITGRPCVNRLRATQHSFNVESCSGSRSSSLRRFFSSKPYARLERLSGSVLNQGHPRCFQAHSVRRAETDRHRTLKT